MHLGPPDISVHGTDAQTVSDLEQDEAGVTPAGAPGVLDLPVVAGLGVADDNDGVVESGGALVRLKNARLVVLEAIRGSIDGNRQRVGRKLGFHAGD